MAEWQRIDPILVALANVPGLSHEDLLLACSLMSLAEDPLSEAEVRWAQAIKAGVESHEEIIAHFTDFEYAVYAIATKGDTDKAVENIIKMQAFREEYEINDTFQQAQELLWNFMLQQPGLLLCVSKKFQSSS